VWAYKPERAIKVAALYDTLLTLFDFEVPLFEKYGLKTYCIGHPIFEQSFDYNNEKIDSFKTQHLLTENIIAITPGSRAQEIKLHLPIFLAAISKANISQPCCVIVNTDVTLNTLIDKIAQQFNVPYVISGDKIVAFCAAKIVLAKIGTNILEIAAAKKAIISCYKMHYLSFVFLKRLIKIRHSNLVNIIANKLIIPELVQNEFSADLVAIKLEELWQSDDLREKQIQQSLSVIRKIGFESSTLASQKAAKIILDIFT
jgi:lipid-A-disaccharide synthase